LILPPGFRMPEFDYLLYKLSDGVLSKAAVIENMEIERCYDRLYLQKIRELNEIRERIEKWANIRK
jgi:hypothetical protein